MAPRCGTAGLWEGSEGPDAAISDLSRPVTGVKNLDTSKRARWAHNGHSVLRRTRSLGPTLRAFPVDRIVGIQLSRYLARRS